MHALLRSRGRRDAECKHPGGAYKRSVYESVLIRVHPWGMNCTSKYKYYRPQILKDYHGCTHSFARVCVNAKAHSSGGDKPPLRRKQRYHTTLP